MSTRSSDSKSKGPLSAIAARRLRQEQQAQATPAIDNTASTVADASRSITPNSQDGQVASGREGSNGLRRHANDSSSNGTTSTLVFSPTAESYIVENEGSEPRITVKLRRNEYLAVQGEYKVIVLSGSVTINGAVLKQSDELHVIAPSTGSLPVIEASYRSKKRKLEHSNGDSGYHSVITLENAASGIRNLGRICPKFEGIWRPAGPKTTKRSFTPITSFQQSLPFVQIPPTWKMTIDGLTSKSSQSPVMFVIGSKSTGKSTFGRVLMNSMLSLDNRPEAIAYLDFDPGQPSFTAPCILSLHEIRDYSVAPSFACFNSTNVVRQHHIGYNSPREDPQYYLKCAEDLVSVYRQTLGRKGMPLVINTCGWTKGLGRELLQELLLLARPTDVVALGPRYELDGLLAEIIPPDAGQQVAVYLLETPPISPGNQQSAAADLRGLQTICYFHSLPRNSEGEHARFDFSTHVTGMKPICASYSGSQAAISAITILDAEIPAHLVTKSLDATIVSLALVRLNDHEHPMSKVTSLQDNTVKLPYVPSTPSSSTTLLLPPSTTITAGLAIVRAINEAKDEIQLLSPITEEEMNSWEADGYEMVIIRGRDEMPIWLMWDARDGAFVRKGHQLQQPYLDFTASGEVAGKGAKEWKVRRNIMRRSQFKGGINNNTRTQ